MVLYRSPASARDQPANATPEQLEAGMEAWKTWAATAGDAIIDPGTPLALAMRLGPGSSTVGGDDIAGYSLFSAASAPDLSDMLASHPHLSVPGNSIDVLELLPMPAAK